MVDSPPLARQESHCWNSRQSVRKVPLFSCSLLPSCRRRLWQKKPLNKSSVRGLWNVSFILIVLLLKGLLLGPTRENHVVQGFHHPPPPFPIRRAFVVATKVSHKNQYQQTRRIVSPWFIYHSKNNNVQQQQQQQQYHHRRLARFILYDSEVSQEIREIVDMSSLTQTILNNGAAVNHTTSLGANDDDDYRNSHYDINDDAPQQQQHLITAALVVGLENYDETDVPMPTQNGGFTHTKASRAKISAANKGNTPWNKGRHRSEEVKARIAAGVRAANRQRFLQKLQNELNMTEAQYEAQQASHLQSVRADRDARRTERGGFRPTEETKRKISRVLKAKYANATFRQEQQQRRQRQQQQMSSSSSGSGPMMSSNNRQQRVVRRGFTHSEETKRKISLALRDRWAHDAVYRQNMKLKCIAANNRPETKRRISQALRQKWKNPDFRQVMIQKFQNRNINNNNNSSATMAKQQSQQQQQQQALTHREKISAAMKAKWQDEAYRQKALAGIQAKKQRRQEVQSATMLMSSSTTTTRNIGTSSSSSRQSMTLTHPTMVKQKVAEQKITRQVVRLVEPRTTTTTESPSPPPNKPIKAVKRKQTTRVVVKKKKASSSTTTSTTSSSSKNEDVATVAKMAISTATLANEKSSPLTTLALKNGAATLNGATHDIMKNIKDDDDDDVHDDDDSSTLKSRGRKKTTGSVSQLRKERRDLYDLLYGDDDDEYEYNQHDDAEKDTANSNGSRRGNDDSRMHQLQQQQQPAQSPQGRRKQQQQQQQQHNFDAQELQRRNGYNNNNNINDNNNNSKRKLFSSMDFGLGDENLDDFDPYGLDDF